MKRHMKMLSLSLLLLMAAGSLGLAFDGAKVFNVDRDFYPYYPSLIKWNKSNAPFTPPDVCGGCHPKQLEEWTGSAHALAFRDPIYQGELNKAVKAVGHEISRQCEGCHSAAGMATGGLRARASNLSPMALAGVSCDICHSISGVTHWQTPAHEPENGSFLELIAAEHIRGAVWHFFRSPLTGLGGASEPLRQALQQAGIGIIIH